MPDGKAEKRKTTEKPSPGPAARKFGELFDWHLRRGTGPGGTPDAQGVRWTAKSFAGAVGVNERTIRNWLKGENLPNDLTSVERNLFGSNPAYDAWRCDLREALDAAKQERDAGKAQPLWSRTEAPYPGLRAFKSEEATIFFGREREVGDLVTRMRDPTSHFLAVVGASGIGKSSLVRAGLLPRLEPDPTTVSRRWPTLSLTPGLDPFTELAIGLADRLPPAHAQKRADIAAALAATPQCISDYAGALLSECPEGAAVVLFIDQFEELFTPAADRHRRSFIELLTRAADDTRLRVLVTLRADFLPQCMDEPNLGALLQAPTAIYPLGSPGRVALLDMIRKPAERAGLNLEEELADKLLQDAGDNPGEALPMVAFCLAELWYTALEHHLTLAAYQAMDGLRGAIGRRAGKLLDDLRKAEGADLDAALPQVFRALVHVDATGKEARRRASRDALRAASTSVPRLIEMLIDGRLLLAEEAGGQATITLAHEAVIQEWPALREWLERNKARMQRVQRLLLALAAPEAGDRQHAAAALGEFGPAAPEAVRPLIDALQDVDEIVREHATIALGRIGSAAPEVVPALHDALLGHVDPWVRQAAAEYLGEIRPVAPEVIRALTAALLNDHMVSVRETAAGALGSIRSAAAEVVQALVTALDHLDPRLCGMAAEALGNIGPAAAEAVPVLVAALGDADEYVRMKAAEALERIRSTPV